MAAHLHAFYLNFTFLVQIGFIDISFSCACYICGNMPYNKRLKFNETDNLGRAISLELMEWGAISLELMGGGGDFPKGGEIPRDVAPGGRDPSEFALGAGGRSL